MLTKITQLMKRRGQGLVEYVLILALIAIAVIAGLQFLGGNASNSISNVGSQVESALT